MWKCTFLNILPKYITIKAIQVDIAIVSRVVALSIHLRQPFCNTSIYQFTFGPLTFYTRYKIHFAPSDKDSNTFQPRFFWPVSVCLPRITQPRKFPSRILIIYRSFDGICSRRGRRKREGCGPVRFYTAVF